MGTLYLVRHGQARFGTDDYDRLSPLGERQCHALGQWFAQRGLQFSSVLRGTLRRHAQSLAALQAGLGDLPHGPAALEWPGLNEYDGDALVAALQLPPEQLPNAADGSADSYKAHFRLLRTALQAWMDGRTRPAGMPDWPGFVAGVQGALDHVRQQCEGDVLLVSSGGPIATAVAQVLGAPSASVVDLNLRIRNSAVTEFAFNPKRHALVSFNHVPHLDSPERQDWITHA